MCEKLGGRGILLDVQVWVHIPGDYVMTGTFYTAQPLPLCSGKKKKLFLTIKINLFLKKAVCKESRCVKETT